MERKSLVWLGATAGSVIGSLVPALLGMGSLSAASIVGGLAGGLAGIWAAVKLADGL